MKKLTLFLSALALFAALRASALELSLEENRGESGTVGYVDIDRVFKEYSGTLNAREEFLGEIKKKEESVNQRKHDIYALKADIARLRQEREFALTLPSLLATQEQLSLEKLQAAAASAAVSTSSVTASAAVSTSSATASAAVSTSSVTASAAVSTSSAVASAAVSTSSAVQVSISTPVPAQVPASTSTLAPVSDAVLAPAPASTSTLVQAPASTAAFTTAVSTQAVGAPTPAAAQAAVLPAGLPGLGIDMPGVAKVPVNYFKFSVSTAVPEIDAAITVKETDLRKKDETLKIYQRQVEKELLEYESHRSEILLGRIYIALKELAAKEEVSVIIDKRNILFGHPAVDLTGKLLEKLEEEQ